MIRVTWKDLDERVRARPSGYREDVMAEAVREDAEGFWLTEEAIERLRAKYPPPPEPTLGEMLLSFAKATARFVSAGMPVLPEVSFAMRLRECRACENWREAEARCARCGCRQLKLWMATEQCPEGRWKAVLKGRASG